MFQPSRYILLASLLVAGTAHADHHDPEEMQFLGTSLHDVAPVEGAPRAPVRAPAWCKEITPDPGYSVGGFVQAIENANNPFLAAKIACSFPGTEKSVQRAAAIIEQNWINVSGLPDKAAVASIALRLDEARYDAGKKQLCSALVVSDRMPPEIQLFMKTRNHLFGCDAEYPAWRDNTQAWHDDTSAYLDQSARPADELVRLGYILNRVKPAFEDPKFGNSQKYLSSYGIDSIDYRALSKENLARLLEVAPYKDNVYAKAVIIESLARARMGIAILDARVAKLVAQDPAWKEVLIDAPQHGVDAYNAAAKQYSAELARSNQFELASSAGAKKQIAGCEPVLRADFLRAFGTHATDEAALAALSEPIASLLFARLVACEKATSDSVFATTLGRLHDRMRYSRGPRTAAYFAQLEAVSKVLADQPKFPFSLARLSFDFAQVGDWGAGGVAPPKPDAGIVKSATTKGDMVHVAFIKTHAKVMSRACVNTGHLLMIDANDQLVWEQRCHDAGWVTVNTTPPDHDVPLQLATGIVPNSYVELTLGGPMTVYKDKSKATLVSFYGFPM